MWGLLGLPQGQEALMTLALGLGLAPRTSFLALNRGLGQEALALAPGAAQERGLLKGLDEGRSRGSVRQARALVEEHLVRGLKASIC